MDHINNPNTNSNKGKVIPFRDGNYPLFSPSLRKKMEDGVSGLTEKPEETVQTLEQIICSTIITLFRQWATNLGKKAGDHLGKATASNQ